MHILEIPSFFPPYGGLFCLDQSKALAAQGNTVRIIACVNISLRLSPKFFLNSHTKPYKIIMDGIEVIRCEMRALPFCLKLNIKRWLATVEKMVDNYVKEYGKPDVIHAHCCQLAGIAAMYASRKHGIPYIITEHLSSQIIVKSMPKDAFSAWQLPYLKEAYDNADIVIPVSPELVDDLEPFFGRGYKWESVSNTIDTHFFKYKKREPMDGREIRLCCLSNFVPRKGYDVLLNAVRRYIDKTGDKINLTVAGKYMEDGELSRMVKNLRLEDVVDIMGEVDKYGVLDILYNSDCLILATRNEAQGLVLLEAMSTGIPVISTDSVPQNVRIESGCRIVETDDYVAMAGAIEYLRQNNWNDCRKASVEVSNMASPEVIGMKLNELFKKVVKGEKYCGY